MCLRTLQTSPKIAEEDITCYKVLTEDLKSPCYGQQYELGKLTKSELVLTSKPIYNNRKISSNCVNEGLHTYSDKGDAIRTVYSRWTIQNNWTDVNVISAPIVVECVIPKGSEYYAGKPFVWLQTSIQYASTQLIPKKIVYDATENAKN